MSLELYFRVIVFVLPSLTVSSTYLLSDQLLIIIKHIVSRTLLCSSNPLALCLIGAFYNFFFSFIGFMIAILLRCDAVCGFHRGPSLPSTTTIALSRI